MHSTLERQLRRLGLRADGETAPSVEQFKALLERVDRAYTENDEARYTLERSNDLSSTEMRQLHQKLASERDRLRALIGCLGDALIVIDARGVIQLANDEASRLVGRPIAGLLGRQVSEVMTSSDRSPALAEHLRRPCRSEETNFVNAGGATVEVAITVNPVVHDGGTTIVFRDISERKKLEGSLRHAQKLESVGRLAAGIAHEINTPVQFVSDNVHFLQDSFGTLHTFVSELLELDAGADTDRAERIAEARDAADWDYLEGEIPKSIGQTLEGLHRIATIVQSMKKFAHNDRGERKSTDLNSALKNTLVVAGHELKSVALAVTDFGDIPDVVCCSGDINQVFLNLIVNAAHAVSDVVERTGVLGKVLLVTRRDGPDVVISIADTGGGIPESVRPHLFEPFFTTKVVGRGSGQGLALARSLIVNKHGGQLTYETEAGVGTTFHIRLPIQGVEPDARAA